MIVRSKGLLAVALAFAVLVCASGLADARADGGCRPLRAIFYAETGSLALAQGLAANASPCANYYVSVPPLAADKTQMRSGVASPIRALGPNFHALADVNFTAWQNWVATTGNSFYQAGIEARKRMAAAGFSVSAGDSWAVNELSSAVRVGNGTSRQNVRDLVRGLYDGDGSAAVKGVVFAVGISQPTGALDTYKARLESWLQDAGFWGDMSAYVGDFLQENYGDVRDYGVPGADVPTRLSFLNAYLEHVIQLASVGPESAAAAAAYLQGKLLIAFQCRLGVELRVRLYRRSLRRDAGFRLGTGRCDAVLRGRARMERRPDRLRVGPLELARPPVEHVQHAGRRDHGAPCGRDRRVGRPGRARRGRLRYALVHRDRRRRRVHARLERLLGVDADECRLRLDAPDGRRRDRDRADEREPRGRRHRDRPSDRHQRGALLQLARRIVLHLTERALVLDAHADPPRGLDRRNLLHARHAAGEPDRDGDGREHDFDAG